VQSTASRSELDLPTHDSRKSNQSQQIRKRRRTTSESSTDEEAPSAKRRSLEVASTHTKRIDLSTTEKQNDYIVNAIERWHKNNKSFWWRNLVARLGWGSRVFKERLDELVQQGRIDAAHIPANFAGTKVKERNKRQTTTEQYAEADRAVRTERTTTKDLSSTESQNNYLIQTVQHWHEKNHNFSWRTLYGRLGLSSEEVRRRVYELVEQGQIDSSLVPPRSNRLVLDTVEKQDQYILDRVDRARLSNRHIKWANMANKLGWSLQTVKDRYFFLMNKKASATIVQRKVVSTPDTACAEPEVIDLTDIPENGTSRSESVTQQSPNVSNNLVLYINECVHRHCCLLQLDLLQKQNNLSTLWRQLGVEFGVQEAVFEELWQRSIQTLYVRDYKAAIVPGYTLVNCFR